jgi:membrane-associated protein
LHVDQYIGALIQSYGVATYLILFLIIFVETGIVVLPFFPGDSLIFVAGAFAATGVLNVFLLFGILAAAAILGDTVNYWIGNFFGEKLFLKKGIIKRKHLEKTKDFFKKHGAKTIIFARFVPIVRTIAPFVAGVGKMKYSKFLKFNIVGGIAWTAIFTFAGYFFGTIPFVKNNLTAIIIAIIVISLIPAVIQAIKFSKEGKKKK